MRNLRKKREEFQINEFLMNLAMTVLVTFSGITFIALGFGIKSAYWDNNTGLLLQLLIPFGVILSATLATTSMMKNMQNTNKIEREKKKQQIINADKYFALILGNMKSSFSIFLVFSFLINKLEEKDLKNLDKDNISEDKKEHVYKNVKDIHQFIAQPLEELKVHLESILAKLETKDLIFYSKNTEDIDRISYLISEILVRIRLNLKLDYLYHNGKFNENLGFCISTIQNIEEFINYTRDSIIEINTYIEDEDLKIKLY